MAINSVFGPVVRRTMPVPANTPAGTPLMVGAFPVVTETKADANNTATCNIRGAFSLTVTGAVTTFGSLVYIDSSGNLQTTASGNTPYGRALGTKGAAAAAITVELGTA